MAGGGDDHPPLFHVKQVSTYPSPPGARQPHERVMSMSVGRRRSGATTEAATQERAARAHVDSPSHPADPYSLVSRETYEP